MTMTEFDYWMASVRRVVTVLKTRFPNLTTEETLNLATECVKATLAAPPSPERKAAS